MNSMELELSDEQIRAALAPYKNNIPITESTRPLLLRKIAQLRAEGTYPDSERSGSVTGDAGFTEEDRSEGDTKISQVEKVSSIPSWKVPEIKLGGGRTIADDASFKEKLSKTPVGGGAAAQVEKANNFPSLKVPEINKFRRLIEGYQVEEFTKSIWENPRHLITPGDTPEILKIGPRYNALHCAAKVGSLEICKRLFEILEGDLYWNLVYPSDPVEVRNKRRDHLIDLYLNTCDKGVRSMWCVVCTEVCRIFA